MDIQENIISQILNSLDFGFIFCVNLVTYLIIKFFEELKNKKITRTLKRIITFISGIVIGFLVLKINKDAKPVIIFYSFFFSLLSFDYIFKPILNKFGGETFNYRKSEDN